MAEPVADGQPAQGGGEEPGGEGVPGADVGDDVHGRGADGDLRGAGAERRRPGRAPLDHDRLRFRERRADRPVAVQAPRGTRLVVADEDEVGAACQFEEHPRAVGVGPQLRAVVDVEGDERAAAGPAGRQLPYQFQAVGGQRGGDPGEMQDPAVPYGVQVEGLDAHRGGRRAGPVVRHLVGVAGAVPGGAEVDAGGARRVPAHRAHVDAVRADRLHEVVAEAVRADPAHPAHGVPGGGQRARHVGLGAADPALEGRHVGEPSRPRGQERHHGLPQRDDVDGGRVGAVRAGGGHGGGGSSGIRWGAGSVDPRRPRC